jgi:ABC-type nitrate/sulfonate/bicarbonate transport system substrate-binding protein
MKRFGGRLTMPAVVLAVAVLGGGPAAAQEKATLKIVFPTTPTTFMLPHFVAKDQGWLDKAGLTVEEVWLVGDANAVRTVISGQADIAAPGTFAVYTALAEGARIKAIASWQPKVDYQLVARDTIKTIKELEGARIGAAGPKGLTIEIPRMVMKKHGADPNKASYVQIGGHEARLQATVANKVDAAIVSILYAAKAKEFANIRVLSSIPAEFPGLAYTYLVVRDNDLTDPAKRKTLETYLRLAVIEGSRFIMENPERAAKIMHGRTPNLKVETIQEVVHALNVNNVWGVNGGLDAESTAYTLRLALEMDAIKKPLSAADVLDTSIVELALSQAGRK